MTAASKKPTSNGSVSDPGRPGVPIFVLSSCSFCFSACSFCLGLVSANFFTPFYLGTGLVSPARMHAPKRLTGSEGDYIRPVEYFAYSRWSIFGQRGYGVASIHRDAEVGSIHQVS